MVKKSGKGAMRVLESILDLSASNVWGADIHQIAKLWNKEREGEDFQPMEKKLLNVLHLAFEVVHYNPEDPRENDKYGDLNGDWVQLISAHGAGMIAIKPKYITKLGDLTMQNVKFVSAATLLELIDRNFGGGWDAIPSNLKAIIESAFDISTSQLPTSRIHLPGGSLERKVKAGYEVLEIEKGTWTEAVFARKKEELVLELEGEENYGDDEPIVDGEEDNFEAETSADDTFYSNYAEEAGGNDDEDEDLGDGMHIETGEDVED